jgi:hypothetical protein
MAEIYRKNKQSTIGNNQINNILSCLIKKLLFNPGKQSKLS